MSFIKKADDDLAEASVPAQFFSDKGDTPMSRPLEPTPTRSDASSQRKSEEQVPSGPLLSADSPGKPLDERASSFSSVVKMEHLESRGNDSSRNRSIAIERLSHSSEDNADGKAASSDSSFNKINKIDKLSPNGQIFDRN